MKRLKTNFMSPSTCPVMKHYGDEFSLLAHKWKPRKSHLSLYKLRCLPVLEASDYRDDLTDGKHLFVLYPSSRGKNRSRGRVERGKWILQGNKCHEQVPSTKSEALNAGSALEVHVLHVWY